MRKTLYIGLDVHMVSISVTTAAEGRDGEIRFSIAVHYTDGGGVSDHVFALAHLLGIQLAPRIPNLHADGSGDVRLVGSWPADQYDVVGIEVEAAGAAAAGVLVSRWSFDIRRKELAFTAGGKGRWPI